MRRFSPVFVISLLLSGAGHAVAGDLPVNVEAFERDCREIAGYSVANSFTMEEIAAAIAGGDEGLSITFDHIDTLLDHTVIDPSRIYGEVCAGPYPFEGEETSYPYRRFRTRGRIRDGSGVLRVGRLIHGHSNSEAWTDGGQICVRMDLFLEEEGRDLKLGTYDTFVRFVFADDRYVILPSLLEGPFVGMITSDDPTTLIVSFRTRVPEEAVVELGDGREFREDAPVRAHEINLHGLEPDSEYAYSVTIHGVEVARRSFRTAPDRGEGEVTFAYTGDSRAGVGGGAQNYMGVNYSTLDKLMSVAWRSDARFLIMGGDLVNGYTTSARDFETQLRGWKQSVAGFWGARAIYPAIGNHEALLKICDRGESRRIYLDRWPYATESAEAVFAGEFLNPRNGPLPSDPRRPQYEENTFTFQYGPVFFIAFNNNYWAVFGSRDYGGSPEGYIMPDQMKWISDQLDRAEADSTVRHVIMYAQEPVFPNGGHMDDAMWWGGDNNPRASTWRGDSLYYEEKGMVEVRNDLARLVGSHRKVAAVLGADEHAYHRVRIGKDVPVGDPAQDDLDGNARIDWPEERCSPLRDLEYDCWYIVSGGAGAPYYSEALSPWNERWFSGDDGGANFRYSSQENILIFQTEGDRISLKVLNPYGELIDEIPDLTSIK